MKTRTGKQTTHLKVQIIQESDSKITMFFDRTDLAPLYFNRDSVPTEHWNRLVSALD